MPKAKKTRFHAFCVCVCVCYLNSCAGRCWRVNERSMVEVVCATTATKIRQSCSNIQSNCVLNTNRNQQRKLKRFKKVFALMTCSNANFSLRNKTRPKEKKRKKKKQPDQKRKTHRIGKQSWTFYGPPLPSECSRQRRNFEIIKRQEFIRSLCQTYQIKCQIYTRTDTASSIAHGQKPTLQNSNVCEYAWGTCMCVCVCMWSAKVERKRHKCKWCHALSRI